MKKIFFSALLILLVCTVLGIASEGLILIFAPQDTLFPRYQFSPEYGLSLFPDVTMVQAKPGRYHFEYHVNSQSYRGKLIPVQKEYGKKNIVVLGDSYSFGIGVNEHEEYPFLLGQQLADNYDVINLGNPAWGLTQEIRRFYDFGVLYKPALVVLEFYENDPEESLKDPVTLLTNGGKLEFRNTGNRLQKVKIAMSRSFLQKSQLYNFFRQRLFILLNRKMVERLRKKTQAQAEVVEGEETAEEKLYCDLLTTFAGDLKQKHIPIVMIAVNGSLRTFPRIRRCIHELELQGALRYEEVLPWFEKARDFGSPEGHLWGPEAHKIVAEHLAAVIRGMGQAVGSK